MNSFLTVFHSKIFYYGGDIASKPARILGQGAFGQVHLIHNTQTGLLAAKVMQNSLFDEKEWEAAGRLQ
ncbi:MAG: hypothetical protein EZS28_032498, partial [Streblomastix strix]